MSDCSPILKRRRSHIVPGTPLTPTSHVSSPIPKRRFKIKTALTPNSSSSSCKRALRNRRDKKKALRRGYRKCKYIEHQAHDSGDSESNSSDLDDASNDSCVTSNSDASDGSYAVYALGNSSQAEAAGFTVPLNQARFAAMDRETVADMIMRRRDEKIRAGRIAASAQLTTFEQYVVRVRDGVGVPILFEPQDPPEQDLPMLFGHCSIDDLPPAPTPLEVFHPTPVACGVRAPYSIFVVPSGRVRVPGRLQLPPPKPPAKAAIPCEAPFPVFDIPHPESTMPHLTATAKAAIFCTIPSLCSDIPHSVSNILTGDATSLGLPPKAPTKSLVVIDIPHLTPPPSLTPPAVDIPHPESTMPHLTAPAKAAIFCIIPSPFSDIPHSESNIPQLTGDATSLGLPPKAPTKSLVVIDIPHVTPPLSPSPPAVEVAPLVPVDILPVRIYRFRLVCDQAVQTSPVKETPLTREGLRDELQALLLSLGL